MTESWRDIANRTIGRVLDECKADGMDLLYLSPEQKKEIKKRIDAAYPFGQRTNFPYKAWLDARKAVFVSLNIPITSGKKSGDTTIGQTSLFN
jgi:hypothetical protein